jgi:nitroimidazol reductase NimA-like FMN-containing flavoprotein (pyridoxamine 5'-phosphate oxidase superfamily)
VNDHRTIRDKGEFVSLTMSRREREAFLAGVHVGVLSVNQPMYGPLAAPVWYTYEPGGTVNVITGAQSRKAHCIVETRRFTLCAQTETAPYKYVSVEGVVTSIEELIDPEERRGMAYRYLGQEFGDLYLESTASQAENSLLIRMTPEFWLTTDFAKQFA